MKSVLTIIVLMLTGLCAGGQDSTLRALDSITVISVTNLNAVRALPAVYGTYIFAGKKSEIIELSQSPADIANKSGRQVFAKIPGLFVYDMDGAGNQINIATRGLDPHRGWEFNIRKDGIITNSDMYGYPASHYSMPLESIGRIELVRGTGSLQYGAQFGGMLNYITKQGDTTRPFSFENISTVGSYNLVSTYMALGGKTGRFSYYGYIFKKSRDGYRDSEHTESSAQALMITYEAGKMKLRAEWARSKYLYRIPGPLTDSLFQVNPRQSSRQRNYFSPDIHVPSIVAEWKPAIQTSIRFTTSAVLGKRNSVQFDKPVNIADTINLLTHQYNNRQVDIDQFNSYTAELRLLQEYRFARQTSRFVAGMQYMNNDLHRMQLGKGSTGSDYDLSLVDPQWGRDVHLKTKNLALFVENQLQLGGCLSLNFGARFESGETAMTGRIVYYPGNDLPVSIQHEFPLLGITASYKSLREPFEWYGGISQAYHPMLFKDLIPGSVYEKVDPNIKDARGYNAELGFRGTWRILRWDVNLFWLKYNNRFGTLAETDNSGNLYTYRTNIGNSLSRGVEVLLQANWIFSVNSSFSLFTSTALIDARYQHATVKTGTMNKAIDGNKVESAPGLITRNGATFRYKKAALSLLYSYTASSYADPLNTVEPPRSTGAVGLIPAYGILDLNSSFRLLRNLEARLSVNNLANKQYFTKRPVMYPGPGVWPSDGTNFNLSFLLRL